MIKAIVCELCGSNDMIKKESYFECQHCGTKHVLKDNVKKIEIKNSNHRLEHPVVGMESSVNFKSFSRKDLILELEGFIENARRTKNENNAEKSFECYDTFLAKHREYVSYIWYSNKVVQGWECEARFYCHYFDVMKCQINEIDKKVDILLLELNAVFKHFNDLGSYNDGHYQVVVMIANDCIKLANYLFDKSRRCFGDYAFLTSILRCQRARDILYMLGDVLTDGKCWYHNDEKLRHIAVEAWKNGIDKHHQLVMDSNERNDSDVKMYSLYSKKIRMYDENFKPKKLVVKINGFSFW